MIKNMFHSLIIFALRISRLIVVFIGLLFLIIIFLYKKLTVNRIVYLKHQIILLSIIPDKYLICLSVRPHNIYLYLQCNLL